VLDEVEYRLIILSPGGDTTNVVERPMPRAPVTDAEWSAETADYARTRAASRACSGELVRAAEKPAARALLMDDRGRFWVERVVPGGTMWDVWEQLNLVGSVAGPRRATDVAADVRGDRLAIAREGQDGSYSVVVFRIVPR
jgi:hypothetical protein